MNNRCLWCSEAVHKEKRTHEQYFVISLDCKVLELDRISKFGSTHDGISICNSQLACNPTQRFHKSTSSELSSTAQSKSWVYLATCLPNLDAILVAAFLFQFHSTLNVLECIQDTSLHIHLCCGPGMSWPEFLIHVSCLLKYANSARFVSCALTLAS